MSAKRRLILHIGTEKTGTTSIQAFLAQNRRALYNEGYLVPVSLMHGDNTGNHRRLSAMAADADSTDDFFLETQLLDLTSRCRKLQQWKDDFINEISQESAAHTVIISSEHLHSRLKADTELRRLHELLVDLFHEWKIIIYIRDPLSTALSSVSTAVKAGSVNATLPNPQDPHWQNLLNHQRTIERWSNFFDRSTITVRLYDKSILKCADIITDFLHTCHISSVSFVRPCEMNLSLDYLGIKILSRVNRIIPPYHPDGSPNHERHDIVGYFEKYFSDGGAYHPNQRDIEIYKETFSKSNEWVRNTYFPHMDTLFNEYYKKVDNEDNLKEWQLDRIAQIIADAWRH